MKVGIITFHSNNNYGAALQCYALRYALLSLGHDVDVINYLPPESQRRPCLRGWGIRSGDFFRKIPSRLLQLRFENRASQIFSEFRREFFSLTKSCTSDAGVESIARQYDAIVTGSDQVWVFERSPHYFLKLFPQYSGLRISYAACCGHNQQREDRFGDVKEWLSNMDSISVRNEFSRQLITSLTDKEVEVVADPTLLIDFEELPRPRKLPFKEYILVYSLSGDRDGFQKRILDAVKQRIGDLPVVAVIANSCPQRCPSADHQIFDATPQEWLWLIANARFVLTDSFHGVLFAVKYKQLFLGIYTEGWRSLRLLDVAKRYGFENCLAHGGEDAVGKAGGPDPDFASIHSLIESHANLSKLFLKRALS